MDYYKLTPMATLSHLKTSSSGLVYREVAIRQRAYGRNTISIGRKVPFVRRRLYQFKNHLKQWPASIQRACQALSACEPLPGKGLCLAGHDGIVGEDRIGRRHLAVQPTARLKCSGFQSQAGGLKTGLFHQARHRRADLPNMQGIGHVEAHLEPSPHNPFQDRQGMPLDGTQDRASDFSQGLIIWVAR